MSVSFLRFLALSLIINWCTAQALTSCPSTAQVLMNDKGLQYQVCPGTDFNAPSLNIVNNIASTQACLDLCMNTPNCFKASYSKPYQICHIKGNPTQAPWVPNNDFDAIQYVQTFVDLSQITGSCPTQVTTINNADGTQSQICPNSDYQGETISDIYNVKDAASCASTCVQFPGCVKAVFRHDASVCYIKSNVNLRWIVNLNHYDSIVVVRSGMATTARSTSTIGTTSRSTTKAPAGSGTTKKTTTITTTTTTTTTTTQTTKKTTASVSSPSSSCTSNPSTFLTDDGSLYEICPKSDYAGSTARTVGNMLSTWDCLQVCNNIPTCQKVVYDVQSFSCYVKSPDAAFVSTAQYDTVRLVNRTAFVPAPNTGLGSWSAPITMPVIPIAAYVVPQQPVSNRVLMFSSWGSNDYSGPTGMTQFADYNWDSGTVSQRTITNTQHDMFCPGISSLQDGRIVITGGENAEATSFYDPATDSFSRGPDMQIARGYQASVTTSSGSVFTIGGSFTGWVKFKNGELLNPAANTWTLLPGALVQPMLTTEGGDDHAWLFGWKDGSVFQAGPSKQQHWYDTKGNGSVSVAGTRDADNDAMCGVNVMYDAVAGKIFSTGGSQAYSDSDAFTKTHITTIGEPFQPSTVQRVADMSFARGFANGVVLPDGTILVVGGQVRSITLTDIGAVLTPELFNPATGQWKTLAPAKIPRTYHSTALLLSDGRVFSAGGGGCPTAYLQDDSWCFRTKDHPDAEIFSPPYLFNPDGSPAPRPIIFSLSSSTSGDGTWVNVGGKLYVAMNDPSGHTFVLIRMGSATHSTNTDQRRIPLTNVVQNQAQYTINLPTDSGILIPGFYYLFALSKAGVPNIARTIQVRL